MDIQRLMSFTAVMRRGEEKDWDAAGGRLRDPDLLLSEKHIAAIQLSWP